jgi:hypothetical protein
VCCVMEVSNHGHIIGFRVLVEETRDSQLNGSSPHAGLAR